MQNNKICIILDFSAFEVIVANRLLLLFFLLLESHRNEMFDSRCNFVSRSFIWSCDCLISTMWSESYTLIFVIFCSSFSNSSSNMFSISFVKISSFNKVPVCANLPAILNYRFLISFYFSVQMTAAAPGL